MSQSLRIPQVSQILTDPRYSNLARLLRELNHRWTPHDGQRIIGEKIFVEGARRGLVECGRKFGKTEVAADLCWRLGNMIKGGQGYYFAAYKTAVRELLWAPKRLQTHGPTEYIKNIHETEMRLTFTTDTFVKCDGADEFKISKGFNPDFVILDEFADYPEDFWYVMSPNFISKDTIVLCISSPPWLLETEPGKPVLFVRIADLWKKYEQQAKAAGMRSKYFYVNLPTHTNPHIPREWLDQEERDLKEMGLEDIWEREYLAKRVVGGGRRIIGTFDRARHVYPHDFIMHKIERNKGILEWVTITDPSTSVFGALVMAVNPYTKEVYFLDEIYEKEENETTEHIIWPRIAAIEDELYEDSDPERFLRVYDEAEKWFAVGVSNEFNVNFTPTEKSAHPATMGLSLLRTLFLYGKGFVSDRCKWLAWEIENYRKGPNGELPKLNQHLIDCSRYGLHAVSYFLSPKDREKMIQPHPRIQRQLLTTPAEDMAEYEAFAGPEPWENSSAVDEEERWGNLH